MSKYGTCALDAVRLCAAGQATGPWEAWETATAAAFGRGTSGQQKGCPRAAFLGLCEEGLVIGVPRGAYTRSRKNKQYALDAIAVLREQPHLADDPHGLWAAVLAGEPKQPNEQMDVVIALWKNDLLNLA